MGGVSMSSGLKLDKADTVYAEKAHELSLKKRNWLRHGIGTTAGKIDEMLLDGATIEQMAKGAKTTKATVSVHLTHLRKVHKLAIVKKDGMLRYDVVRMDGNRKTKKKARKSD
jgi:DNA-binding transcriptional ArsR family regulator